MKEDYEIWFDEQLEKAYQRGLHESAIKVDKEMMAFLKDHNESGDFLKKLTDGVLADYKESLVKDITELPDTYEDDESKVFITTKKEIIDIIQRK